MTRRSTRPTACPDPQMWARVLAADTSSGEEGWLAEHLAGCAECRRALEAAAGGQADDRLPLAVGPEETPGGLERAIRGLIEDRAGDVTAEVSSLAGLNTTVLEPASDPAHLGRLGPYSVTEVIGQGGMGIVLKAFDPTLRRFVAVKVLRPHLASNPAARKRFEREARAAAAVRHEHVVAIHGVDEANGLPYLVMEFVPGFSLQEWLDRLGPLDPDEVLRVGLEIAEGLAAAHEGGLVHRDVKPANILLEGGRLDEGEAGWGLRVKITDFGLARTVDEASLTQSGVIAGTPPYMAPEQAWGAVVDHRADLFSLGSVLYALCAGRPPFPGDSALAVLKSVAEDQPAPLRDLNPDVPAWLADLIALLHAKSPARRVGSAAEVARLLRQYLAHRADPDRVPPPPLPGRRPRPSRRWLLVLVGVLGLLTAGGLVAVVAVRLSHAWGRAPEVTADAPRAAGPMARAEFASENFHNPVFGVAFSPGGELVATGDHQGVVRVWQLPNADPMHVLTGHPGRVWSVAFSPDGRLLASAGGEWDDLSRGVAVILWDVLTGREVRRLAGHDRTVFCVAFSPDGKTLATASADHTVRLWDPATGRERAVLEGHAAAARHLAFSPDGRTLASGGFDGAVWLWDVATGKAVACLKAPGKKINCVAFSPDGRTLAAAENPESAQQSEGVETSGRVVLWDVRSRAVRLTLPAHAGRVWCVAYSPDGAALVSGGAWQGRGELKFWNAATGAERLDLHAHLAWVEGLAFSPDGARLASVGGLVGHSGDLIVWNLNPAAFR